MDFIIQNIMKHLKKILIVVASIFMTVSCDYLYTLDLVNNFERGIYIWSPETGLKKGDDPVDIDELNDKWYLNYIEAGEMGSFADMMTGLPISAKELVDLVFRENEVLFVAIFDAEALDNNWGIGKMSDYVIQKYWLKKEDVVEADGETYKTISFPPNEGMKDVEMEPAFGTYQ